MLLFESVTVILILPCDSSTVAVGVPFNSPVSGLNVAQLCLLVIAKVSGSPSGSVALGVKL